ncbi:sodium bicarbonate transporter-like protein 11 isoform X2 [Daphnia magna]|uniref:sodium bicarbonate transporter-like protein 11 isoform X2 n=1 Tax=Daphnia magna TaxID=35525 RepID=UPI001E1BCBAA|nr:sodium bicarbonate transporter-like protein 11 isoform X2 [Daphnia magna]
MELPPASANNVLPLQHQRTKPEAEAAILLDQQPDGSSAATNNGLTGGEAVLNFAASVPSAKRAAKRWKERNRTMAATRGGKTTSTGMKSTTMPLMVANSLMSPGNTFVLCDSQCVVEINAPSGVVNAEPSLQPQPVFKRRCSLTMPYPALYGSWQVQTASPVAVTAPQASKTEKGRQTSTYDSPLTERKVLAQRAERKTLQRRWSTFQMNVDQLHLHQPHSAPSTEPPVLPMLTRARPSGGRARSGDVSATIDEQTESENCETAMAEINESSAGEGQRRNISEIPRSLTLSNQRFNNNGNRATPVEDVDTSPSVVSSYLGEDSCHQLSAIHLQDVPGSTTEKDLVSTALVANDDEDEEVEDEDLHLITCTLQRLPLKDFGAEVRPAVDITQFLQQSVLLLDVTENSPSDLVDLLLSRMVPSVAEEAKMILFTHDTVPMLARTIQATCTTGDSGTFDYDQSWICALCNLPTLTRRHVGIVRLKHPANMGHTCHEVRLFVLVLCPSKEKGTKNALETGRTFATLLADMDLRQRLLEARTEDEFKRILLKHTQELAEEQAISIRVDHGSAARLSTGGESSEGERLCRFGQGIREDLARRLPHYVSDYKDGLTGVKTPQKVLSTTLFLYFACILPAIAFGVLNDHNTHGKIVIYSICEDFQLDFYAMYGCVGLWSSFFLVLYSLFDVSRLMRWSTRSTEEIFALFISIAFCVDAFRDTVKNFQENYYAPACKGDSLPGNLSSKTRVDTPTNANNTVVAYLLSQGNASAAEMTECNRASSLLFLLLMFGTVWIGVSLYNFNKTPYLQAGKREALADYSLPVAVITLSFVGSYLFQDVTVERFRYDDKNVFMVAPLERLSWLAVLAAMGMGFSLSLLFFMDQNITSAMVNNPCNKLKKGPAYHWDLFVVALVTAFLSVFGLPWMHATLPHSPLHVRGLADVEERVDQGHVYEIIVKVRETRLTGMISHFFIGLSLFLLPYPLAYIPTAVLDGLFLYMAVTALNGNQMFERITLLFMEQAAYPPNHYIRRVPQRKIHQFTGCQVTQLLVMCLFGFAPWAYMKMVFPLIILFLLPVRHRLVPQLIEGRFLEALDGEHQ